MLRFIIGATSTGETNTLLFLVEQIGAWDRMLLFTKQPSEPLYKYFIDCINKVENKHKGKVRCVLAELQMDVDLETLQKMYKHCTQKKENFFLIDLNQTDPKLKYRKNVG